MTSEPNPKRSKMAIDSIEAWYMCDDIEDQKAENRCEPNQPVSLDHLQALGVRSWHLPPAGYEYPAKAFPYEAEKDKADPALMKVREENGMTYADIITITPEALPGYHEKLKSFFEEHLHEDDEIRYILSGSGYFDVRDKDNRWIRISCKEGAMISLPEGIYHRFTLDSNEYAQAMRLFVGNPVWTPVNRSDETDSITSRKKYVENFF
eukprot:Sspe_Gene.69099::Locus_40726_Transcript_1_3_Confidence_0.500_Length_847::g.69099::m.69099/K08967/mtnD, mtnZ, ADI1; 1,2-dihydroxy-3-keto-5-methylthiopentene dioxygenase